MAFVFAVAIVVVTLTSSVTGDSGFDGNCLKNFDNCTGNTFCGAPGNSGSPNAQFKCYYCDCANMTQCYFVSGTTIGCNCTGFGTTGEFCETDIDECASNPCSPNGVCIDGVNSYTCICNAGWTGPMCNMDIDECAMGSPCPSGYMCSNHPGGFCCN